MRHTIQAKRITLGTIILALAMTFSSMPAYATPLFYNVLANPVPGRGDTSFDLTFFIDSSDIPATGQATVTFSSVDVIFTGSAFAGPSSFTYSNDQTGIQNFFGNIQLVPFTGVISSTGALGIIQGVQSGPGGAGFGIARMFFNPANSFGPLVQIMFFGSATNKFNTQVDDALIDVSTLTGPTPVPEPSSALLVGLGLAGLCMRGRR